MSGTDRQNSRLGTYTVKSHGDEAPGVPLNDVQEVSNYVAALHHGMDRLRGRFPLSLRLIREIHAVLLSNGRGSDKQPGEFRTSQHWIGGTRPGTAAFVPPPEFVHACMSAFELFLHEERPDLPLLVKAGLVYVQLETIHPFFDGNGRLGRLLITFLLCAAGSLPMMLTWRSSVKARSRSVRTVPKSGSAGTPNCSLNSPHSCRRTPHFD